MYDPNQFAGDPLLTQTDPRVANLERRSLRSRFGIGAGFNAQQRENIRRAQISGNMNALAPRVRARLNTAVARRPQAAESFGLTPGAVESPTARFHLGLGYTPAQRAQLRAGAQAGNFQGMDQLLAHAQQQGKLRQLMQSLGTFGPRDTMGTLL